MCQIEKKKTLIFEDEHLWSPQVPNLWLNNAHDIKSFLRNKLHCFHKAKLLLKV